MIHKPTIPQIDKMIPSFKINWSKLIWCIPILSLKWQNIAFQLGYKCKPVVGIGSVLQRTVTHKYSPPWRNMAKRYEEIKVLWEPNFQYTHFYAARSQAACSSAAHSQAISSTAIWKVGFLDSQGSSQQVCGNYNNVHSQNVKIIFNILTILILAAMQLQLLHANLYL